MKWMFILLLFIACVFIVYSYSNDKGRVLDRMTDSGPYGAATVSSGPSALLGGASMSAPSVQSAPASIQGMPISMGPSMQSAPAKMMQPAPAAQSAPSYNSGMGSGSSSGSGYDMQPVANPSDLLPQDQNSQWANLNPLNGSIPVPVDLLQAGYQIGLDTIGQTLKNANYQLRSDPIIEKKDIGPWMQSTIEPDYGRIPLEIGCGGR